MSSRDALTNAPPALSAAGPDTLLSRAFVLVWLYSALTTMAWGTLLPVVPLYVRGPLDGGDIAVGAVMSAAVLVAALAQPLLGRAADRRGRRVLLVGGPLTFSAFVLLFTIVDSPTQLFGLRTAAEIGEAAFVIGAITVVNDLAPDDRRGEAYNIYSLSTWAGVGLGPVLGDFVLRASSFTAVWVVSGALSLAGAAVAVLLPETRRRTREPVSRSGMFSRSAIVPGSILAFEMFALAAVFVFSSLYARELGMAGAGLVLLTNAAVLVSIRILGRRLPDRLGVRRAATIGVFFAVTGAALPAIYPHPIGLYLGAASFGVGHAFLYPALFMLAVGRTPEDERSAALGSLKAFEAIGFAAAAALLGVTASLVGYRGAFGLAAVVTSLGFVPLLYAWRRGILDPISPQTGQMASPI